MSELEALVTAQGLKVRELKAAKGDKAAVEAEVKILLGLKQKLTAAGGGGGQEAKGGKKGKKK